MDFDLEKELPPYTDWGMTKDPNRQGAELYDLVDDFDENVNLAIQPEFGEVVAYLSDMLHAGWRESAACNGGFSGCKARCPTTPSFAAEDCFADCVLVCGEELVLQSALA